MERRAWLVYASTVVLALVAPECASAASMHIDQGAELAPTAFLYEGAHLDLPVVVSGPRSADVVLHVAPAPALDVVVEQDSSASSVAPAGDADVTVMVRLVVRRTYTPNFNMGQRFDGDHIDPSLAVVISATSTDASWSGAATSQAVTVVRAPTGDALWGGWWTDYLQKAKIPDVATCPELTASTDGVPRTTIREGETVDCWVRLQYPLDGPASPNSSITISLLAHPTDRVTIDRPTATFTAADWRRVHHFRITAIDDHAADTRREAVAIGLKATPKFSLWGERIDDDLVPQSTDKQDQVFWRYDTEGIAGGWAMESSYGQRLAGYLAVEDASFEPLFELSTARVSVREGGAPAIVWVRLKQKPPTSGWLRLRLDGTNVGDGMLETMRDVKVDLGRWNWWYPLQVVPKDGIRPTKQLRAHPWLDFGSDPKGDVNSWGRYEYETAFTEDPDKVFHHPIPTFRVDVLDTDKPPRRGGGYAMNMGCVFNKHPGRRVVGMECISDGSDSVGEPPHQKKWWPHVCVPRGTYHGRNGTYLLYGTHQKLQALVRGRWVTLRTSKPVFAGPEPGTGRVPAQCGIHYQLGWAHYDVAYPANATMLRYVNYGFKHEKPYNRYLRLDMERMIKPPSWRP